MENHFKADMINRICNICFIPADLNERIRSKEPRTYFRGFKENLDERRFNSILDSRLIPFDQDSGIWDTNIKSGYGKFIKRRAKLLAREFQRFMSVPI